MTLTAYLDGRQWQSTWQQLPLWQWPWPLAMTDSNINNHIWCRWQRMMKSMLVWRVLYSKTLIPPGNKTISSILTAMMTDLFCCYSTWPLLPILAFTMALDPGLNPWLSFILFLMTRALASLLFDFWPDMMFWPLLTPWPGVTAKSHLLDPSKPQDRV